jgi:hypothetical protein
MKDMLDREIMIGDLILITLQGTHGLDTRLAKVQSIDGRRKTLTVEKDMLTRNHREGYLQPVNRGKDHEITRPERCVVIHKGLASEARWAYSYYTDEERAI